MTYQETLQYLFTSTPVFEHSGASAYKPGLERSIALDNYLGNPHKAYKTIHVGGTNGKGSVSHLLAAILQLSGYKVGLYTSPHLRDFRERIRVNGHMISEEYVVDFVDKHRSFFESVQPSFFELASTMAFDYFRYMEVDYAIIEVGLGGRLDSTNIITPVLSVITNVSFDHTQFLGKTLGEIAYEKAGIIKENIPVVIGEPEEGTIGVFEKKAQEMNANLYTPSKNRIMNSDACLLETGEWSFDTVDYGLISGKLRSVAQSMNAGSVFCALRALSEKGIEISKEAVKQGFERVVEITGLQGRWQEVLDTPYVVLDVGHNEAAWVYNTIQIEEKSSTCSHLFMVIGFSNDKDIDAILKRMPEKASYIFTQASVERALPAETLKARAEEAGLNGVIIESVGAALAYVLGIVCENDMIFVGGSHFIVAEALPLLEK